MLGLHTENVFILPLLIMLLNKASKDYVRINEKPAILPDQFAEYVIDKIIRIDTFRYM